MKTPKRTKGAAQRGMTAVQRRRLERRAQLLERYEGTSQTFADALAVLHALTFWVDDAADKAVKAMAARDKAKAALEAHLTKAIAAVGKERRTAGLKRMVAASVRLGLYDDELKSIPTPPESELIKALHKSSAKAGAAVDEMVAFVDMSNKRIDGLERRRKKEKQ